MYRFCIAISSIFAICCINGISTECRGTSCEVNEEYILARRDTVYTITSPNYPFDYPSAKSHIYHIVPVSIITDNNNSSTPIIICFWFKRFNLNYGENGAADKLSLGIDDAQVSFCKDGTECVQEAQHTVWDTNLCGFVEENSYDVQFLVQSNNTLSHTGGSGFIANFTIRNIETDDFAPKSKCITRQGDLYTIDGTTDCVVQCEQRKCLTDIAPCNKTGQWTCANRKCISADQLCDFTVDCDDGSDEDYTHGRCLSSDVSLFQFPSCDFEYDTCGYLGLHGWHRMKTSSKAHSEFSPNVDHTSLGIYGWFLSTSFTGTTIHELDYARFITQSYRVTHNSCLSFWYYMYGVNIGDLKVIWETQLVWKVTGNQGPHWHRGTVLLNPQTSNPKSFAFQTEKRENQKGEILLDDIYLQPSITTCNVKQDALVCLFEYDTCGLEIQGDDWSVEYSDQHDDTYGYVLHIRSLTTIAPSLPTSGDSGFACLSFWYFGDTDGESVTVSFQYIKVPEMVVTRTYTTVYIGKSQARWRPLNIELKDLDNTKVQISIDIEDTNSSSLYLDELSLTKGRCYSNIDEADYDDEGCPDLEFDCGNGVCQPEEFICDSHQDCESGIDEAKCNKQPPAPPAPPTHFPDYHTDDDHGLGPLGVVSILSISVASIVVIFFITIFIVWRIRLKRRTLRSDSLCESDCETSVQGNMDTNEVTHHTAGVQGDIHDAPPSYLDALRQHPSYSVPLGEQPYEFQEMTVWSTQRSRGPEYEALA